MHSIETNESPTKQLFQAIIMGDLDAAKLALKNHADVNAKNTEDINAFSSDATPLSIAALFSHNLKMVKLLVENGAILSLQDYKGDTIFHDIVNSIIVLQANQNILEKKELESICMYLLQKATPQDLQIKNKSGHTAFDLIKKSPFLGLLH